MIKGVGKQIVLLNNTESDIFEQAIFILRSGGKVPYQDMVRECERMMNSHIHSKRRSLTRNWWKIGFFALLIAVIGLIILLIL